jgi:hypothetical protein
MTYYDNLVKHVHAAMEKHPRSPVVMATDNFQIVATGGNTRKIASVIRKCRAQGRVTAVFQKPDENQTFVY